MIIERESQVSSSANTILLFRSATGHESFCFFASGGFPFSPYTSTVSCRDREALGCPEDRK
jgi:hypothetical protein